MLFNAIEDKFKNIKCQEHVKQLTLIECNNNNTAYLTFSKCYISCDWN